MTEASKRPDVQHDTDAHRFEVRTEAGTAFLAYNLAAGLIVFTHTEVPEAMEGQGIGGALARAGMEYARAEGRKVVPICPFVAAWLRRHPEHADLIRRPAQPPPQD